MRNYITERDWSIPASQKDGSWFRVEYRYTANFNLLTLPEEVLSSLPHGLLSFSSHRPDELKSNLQIIENTPVANLVKQLMKIPQVCNVTVSKWGISLDGYPGFSELPNWKLAKNIILSTCKKDYGIRHIRWFGGDWRSQEMHFMCSYVPRFFDPLLAPFLKLISKYYCKQFTQRMEKEMGTIRTRSGQPIMRFWPVGKRTKIEIFPKR